MSKGMGRIVVGIDFSEQSRCALVQALRLAQWADASVHAVHVIESVALGDLAEMLGRDRGAFQNESTEEARGQLEEFSREAAPGAAGLELSVRVGNVFQELLRTSEEEQAGLLVLGSRGADDSCRPTSILSTRCIRKAAMAVMVVRGAHTRPFGHVGAFVDFSEQSPRVLEQALRIAHADRSRLSLYHVYLPPWKVVRYRAPSRLPGEEEQRRYKERCIERLKELTAPHEAALEGLEVGYQLIESSEKVVGIDEFIARSGVDLVVLNTRGRTGLKAILMGTVAEHIIRTSPCSVLTVKPEDFEYAVG